MEPELAENNILSEPAVSEDLTKSKKIIVLAGNPNCGKTTIFNQLTGLNQRTGNFPGVTVEKVSGSIKSSEGKVIELVDLPGIYSLSPNAADERVTCEVLLDAKNPDHPNTVVIVSDTFNLKRGLLLATYIIDLQLPCILVLNDMSTDNDPEIDTAMLGQLLGVKTILCNARKKTGIDELKKAIFMPLAPPIRKFIDKAQEENTEDDIQIRFEKLKHILEKCVKPSVSSSSRALTDKLDAILTHKFFGFLIFLFVLLSIFQSVFFIASYPMQWIESSFMWLSSFVQEQLPEGMLSSLLVSGVLAGLSGILVFVPQIALLFIFIAVLEETGYMARVSFIMDRLMKKFGLNGRSVIPLISGVACAVPAIMSARTINNWKERLITILVTPLMSCSARLPVYILLISLIVPQEEASGFFNLQGLILMSMYLLGFVAALGSAWLMKFIVRAKEKSYFIMEMPLYRMPHWPSVGLTVFQKVRIFIFDAGKIIMAVSVILWGLSSFGPGDSMQKIEEKYSNPGITLSKEEINKQMAAEKLEVSYAGHIGQAIEPVIRPLGFNWKIGIALVTSFAAREVFVATMATIYSVGDDDVQPIRQKMIKEIDRSTGMPVYSYATVLSLLIFYAFAMQCASTLAVVFRETGKWKWPIFQFIYMGALAYLGSMFVYNLFK